MKQKGTIIFFCGKMGAGKSTKAIELAKAPDTVLFSEDHWLSTIYPEEINVLDDYLKYSSRLKPLIKTLVKDFLNSGISVVMDFPGNTKNQRAWFREIFLEDNIPHKLIYLQVDDELCLSQIEKRRATNPERAHFDTEEVFHQVTSHFQAPSENENFNIEVLTREKAGKED